ncbi:MAG: CBS domain-containing protein, partial [Candidatus Krumholzibacteriota bacterium]|nr:CBS domain-containing protein [Candidatus Krumholzibacteriota bacterium]
NLRVSDFVSPGILAVDPRLDLQSLVDDYFLKYRYSFFPVADNGRYLGIVSLDHFKDLDRGSWATTRVGEVLDPEQEHPLVYPEDPAGKIYFLIMQKGISLVPVLSADGILTAVISRGDFLKIIKKMSAGV